MPSILNEEDKSTVKRFIPKQSNKIQAVAVARLFVAHPNKLRWTYTGLQGAVALVNDLVGNTYWIKMVDISPSGRGVIWDQEIFDTWSYNQDRTFFHTFELEDCLAGLSFVNEKEAHTFKKKMDDREKNASKATRQTPFGGSAQPVQKHGRLGGFFHRSSSNHSPESSQFSLPPQAPAPATLSHSESHIAKPASEFALLDAFDPLWREHFGQDLRDKGLTDDFIKSDQLFIVNFIKEEQERLANETNSSSTAPNGMRAPPPPPPGGNASPAGSKRGSAPPPPPPSRRAGKSDGPEPDSPQEREPSPPPRPRFKAPPPLTDAGKFANEPEVRRTPPRPNPVNQQSGAPPPPPRASGGRPPPENENPNHKHMVPPPFAGGRAPPQTPARGPVPPPPPRRSVGSEYSAPPVHAAPPPLPPKVPISNAPPLPPPNNRPVPPPPALNSNGPPIPPPLPPPNNTGPPPPPLPPPNKSGPLPPPLPPPNNSGPPPPPPPPLPPVGAGGPPPPPPPPPPNSNGGPPAPAPPKADHQHKAMLGAITTAGGIGSLKKVDRSQIRDRSEAQVGGDSGGGGAPPAGAAPVGGGGGGGMADALAAALQKRKEKVSRSDDESDNDDW